MEHSHFNMHNKKSNIVKTNIWNQLCSRKRENPRKWCTWHHFIICTSYCLVLNKQLRWRLFQYCRNYLSFELRSQTHEAGLVEKTLNNTCRSLSKRNTYTVRVLSEVRCKTCNTRKKRKPRGTGSRDSSVPCNSSRSPVRPPRRYIELVCNPGPRPTDIHATPDSTAAAPGLIGVFVGVSLRPRNTIV